VLILDWLGGRVSLERWREPLLLDPEQLRRSALRGLDPRVERADDGERFIWSRGTRTELQLELIRPGPRRLLLSGFPLRGPSLDVQAVELRWDGHSLGSLRWTESATLERELPAHLAWPGRHRLELIYARVARPAELLPASDDQRLLAMAWTELRLLPANSVGRGPEPENVEAPKGSGPLLAEGELWWRWTAQMPGAALEMEASAGTSGARVVVVRDGEEGRWQPIAEIDLQPHAPGELQVDLGQAPASVSRVGVLTERGSIRLRALRSTLPAQVAPRRPPIVLFTLDTTRRDHVGAMSALGDPRRQTDGASPHLDRIARESILWNQAYSPAPVTAPTHATLLLAQDPAGHGLRINGQRLPPIGEDHLAARLQAFGYRTAAFVSLGVLASDAGFAQGFEHFDDQLDHRWWRFASELNARLLPWLAEQPEPELAPSFVWVHYSDPHKPYGIRGEQGLGATVSIVGGPQSGVISTIGLEHRLDFELGAGSHELQIAPATARPTGGPNETKPSNWGLILRALHVEPSSQASWTLGRGWTMVRGYARCDRPATVHLQIAADAPPTVRLRLTLEDLSEPRELRRRYREEVMAMDRAVGEVEQALRQRGWWDDTIVLVVADHGEDLGENGHFGHVEHVGPTLSLVPMLLRDPRFPARSIESPVGIIDVAPTLMARLGLPPSPRWVGVDALARPSRRPIRMETFPPEAREHWRAIVAEGWKIEARVDSVGAPIERPRWFDLERDPRCRHDLGQAALAESLGWALPEPERRQRLLDAWMRWTSTVEDPADVDPQMHERLRALGYID
jgi:arylsulfatase A-like enzyme